MQITDGKLLIKKETKSIIEHLLIEEKLSNEDYLIFNRLIEVLEEEGITMILKE